MNYYDISLDNYNWNWKSRWKVTEKFELNSLYWVSIVVLQLQEYDNQAFAIIYKIYYDF